VIIGQAFDNSVIPIAAGFVACGVVALALVIWGERGQLFTRPGTTIKIPQPPRD
jgi:MFS transporter, DHA1 family, multidrug resistance protein